MEKTVEQLKQELDTLSGEVSKLIQVVEQLKNEINVLKSESYKKDIG